MVPENKHSLLGIIPQLLCQGSDSLSPTNWACSQNIGSPLHGCVLWVGRVESWWLGVIYPIVCPFQKSWSKSKTNTSWGLVITVHGVSASHRPCGCRRRWSCDYSARTSSCTTRCARLPWTTSPCRSWLSPAVSQHHLCSIKSNEDLPGGGGTVAGGLGDILEGIGFWGDPWWGSQSNAQPCCHGNALSCVSLCHFGSFQLSLIQSTYSIAPLILEIFVG